MLIADPDSAAGAAIWVADGTYRERYVTMQSGHRLYGGFTGYGGLEETELTAARLGKQPDWVRLTVMVRDDLRTSYECRACRARASTDW